MKVRQLPMVNARFGEVFHRERRGCECEIPMVSRKWNDALGTLVDIRLCCAAKTVEAIAEKLGIDAPKLYEAFDFDPKWVWDCTELHQCEDEGGKVRMQERGVPPAWLLSRLQKKGIEVRNLPADLAETLE